MQLVTGKQMRKIDELAMTRFQMTGLLLMEHAGGAIFHQLMDEVREKRVLIFCGTGNNGGDGFVLARLLYQAKVEVTICFVGHEHSLGADAKNNYLRCREMGIPFVCGCVDADIFIDALFGTGLSREIEGIYEELIHAMNDYKAKIISIDIPSGICAENGAILGIAVQADETYTLQVGKIGLYLYPGRQYSGKISVLDIQIPLRLIQEQADSVYLIEKQHMRAFLPKRSLHSNKGSYGKVLCIGGSSGMSGAISMAALSALRVGCGMMTCAVPLGIRDIIATNILESMVLGLRETNGMINHEGVGQLAKQLPNYSCLLVGCGIGRSKDITELLYEVMGSEKPLVVDADGLHALKPLLSSFTGHKEWIITPHLKEFAQLIEEPVASVVENPLIYAKMFTKKFPNVVLVLKSETTLVMKEDVVYINTYGNNGLAKGGSGDVLAGIITGLYAQNNHALEAAVLGVFLHAYSADILLEKRSEHSILPTDIIEQVTQTIWELKENV